MNVTIYDCSTSSELREPYSGSLPRYGFPKC